MSCFCRKEKIYLTKSGIKVRSKSEMMIADALFLLSIPFVYKPQIVINGIEFHPDFIILSPFDGREIIWEHFGRMSNREYQRRTAMKLQRPC